MECVTDPADRANTSLASEDLLAGQGIFNPKLKETLGFSICLSPPGTRMFKKHPLSDKIREVLNKHRVTQTSEQKLEKIIMDSGSLKLHKELSTRGTHTLRSKVQSFTTVTADEDADQVLFFLNVNTSVSAAYVSTMPMGDFYVTIPTRKTLSTQHNLKQELLFFLGLYNHYIASHATNSCSKQTIQQISEAQGIQLELSLRWTAYAYKSIEEIIFSVAEKLGAACLLLRIEAAVHQSAPQLRRELVYRGDIVGPSITNKEALKKVETAPPNTLKTIQKDKTSPKAFCAPSSNKKGNLRTTPPLRGRGTPPIKRPKWCQQTRAMLCYPPPPPPSLPPLFKTGVVRDAGASAPVYSPATLTRSPGGCVICVSGRQVT